MPRWQILSLFLSVYALVPANGLFSFICAMPTYFVTYVMPHRHILSLFLSVYAFFAAQGLFVLFRPSKSESCSFSVLVLGIQCWMSVTAPINSFAETDKRQQRPHSVKEAFNNVCSYIELSFNSPFNYQLGSPT